jgi:hypothetical protein
MPVLRLTQPIQTPCFGMLDSDWADAKFFPDLDVGHALGNQMQDFLLPCRQIRYLARFGLGLLTAEVGHDG